MSVRQHDEMTEQKTGFLWRKGKRSLTRLIGGVALLGFGFVSAASAATVTRVSSFEYDPTTGLLTKEIIEPDNPSLKVETTYTYDAFGNKITTTTSGQGITSRTATATFDSTGRFPVVETNALGHQETRTFDAAFGNRLSLTGPNALTTNWTYDGFGRQTGETLADGNGATIEYLYCSGVAGGTLPCPTHAKFAIRTTPVDSLSAPNGPVSISYADARGRVIREETQGFDGTAIYVDTEYNHLGQVARTSRPYYAGATPVWTTATYDLLDRVLTQTLPDNSTSSWDYSGLDTKATNDKGQEKRTVVNSQGWTTHVYEASNTLNYLSTFEYDASGNLTKTTDHAGNITTATYNVRGFKTAMTDPDMGSTSYTYNVLGELLTETDAKLQVTSFTYDVLGRTLTRTDADMVTTWTYDTSPTKGIGKIHTVATDNDYLQTMTYDSLGRESAVSTQLELGVSGLVSRTYDANGRVATVTNPNGLVTQNVYTSLGYLSQIRNNATQAIYWEVNAMDAAGEITSQTHGNGVTTVRSFDNRGWLTDIEATASGSSTPNVQDLTYTFDTIGNMASRTDTNRALTENFGYDALNRLVSSNVNSSNLKTIAYDALGNITSKSDTGTYTYGGVGQPVHGVTAITGPVTTTFTYDANGNMLTGNNRTITWNAANQPLTITRGGSTVSFAYGPDNNRIKQTVGTLTTYYFAAGYLEREDDTATGETRWLNYIHGPGGMVALVAETIDSGNNQTDVTRYYHLDHLGSIETITDSAGLIAEANSYDSWGARRFETTWADDFLETITSETNRGFTSHEHLEEVGLVHMNGRLYDARIGRMISADPFVQAPLNPQNYNRYTYVLNNPLAYTDPSGFFFKKIKSAFKKVFRAAISPLGFISKVFGPQIASIVNVAVSAFCGPAAPACAAAGQFQIAQEQGASFGQSLKSAAIAGAASYISGGGLSIGNPYADVVIHGVARGGLSVAQGGKFGSAFLSGAFNAGIGGIVPEFDDFGLDLARSAVLGGTSAVIGGGKFANGAKTAAFQYAASYGAGLALRAARHVGKTATASQRKRGVQVACAHPAAAAACWGGRVVLDAIAKGLAGGAVTAGAGSLHGDTPEGVQIFRSVGQRELADIEATGQFRIPEGGVAGKYFAVDLANARVHRDRLANFTVGGGIVQTTVRQETFQNFEHGVDAGVPFLFVPSPQMNNLNRDARQFGIRQVE